MLMQCWIKSTSTKYCTVYVIYVFKPDYIRRARAAPAIRRFALPEFAALVLFRKAVEADILVCVLEIVSVESVVCDAVIADEGSHQIFDV